MSGRRPEGPEKAPGIGGRTLIIIAIVGALGWGLLVVLVFTAPWQSQAGANNMVQHASYEPATIEGPPVLLLRHLRERGFDEAALDAIEPHLHVLNAALVTIVELKQRFEEATVDPLRQRLRSEAVHFHTTADLHEEQIERLLPDSLSGSFHTYIRERESAVGLHSDTMWHRHADPAHRGVSPGFETNPHPLHTGR